MREREREREREIGLIGEQGEEVRVSGGRWHDKQGEMRKVSKKFLMQKIQEINFFAEFFRKWFCHDSSC